LTSGICAGQPSRSEVQITMLTVDVAPKLKFMEAGAFRSWNIPIGFDFHVIIPPSNPIQYLDMGMQFGAGFEYQVRQTFPGRSRRLIPSDQQTDQQGKQLRGGWALFRHWVLTEIQGISFLHGLTTLGLGQLIPPVSGKGLVVSDAFDADRIELLVEDGESVPSRIALKPEWSEHSSRPTRVLA